MFEAETYIRSRPGRTLAPADRWGINLAREPFGSPCMILGNTFIRRWMAPRRPHFMVKRAPAIVVTGNPHAALRASQPIHQPHGSRAGGDWSLLRASRQRECARYTGLNWSTCCRGAGLHGREGSADSPGGTCHTWGPQGLSLEVVGHPRPSPAKSVPDAYCPILTPTALFRTQRFAQVSRPVNRTVQERVVIEVSGGQAGSVNA